MTKENKALSYSLYVLATASVFFVLLFRQGAELWFPPLIWEDGTLFLSDALTQPFFKALLTPFQGYLHILPRCVATSASVTNLYQAPLTFRLISVLIAALVLSFPLTPLFNKIFPLTVRLLLVGLTALLPWHTETLGNITCLHWYMFYFLALLSMADLTHLNITEITLLFCAVLLAIFSTPLSILCVPIFLFRLLKRKGAKSERFLFATLILLVGIMLIIVKGFLAPQNTPIAFANLPSYFLFIIKAIGYKVVCLTAIGQTWSEQLLKNWIACYLAVLSFGLIFLFIRLLKPQRTHAIILYYILTPILFTAIMRRNYVAHFAENNLYFGATRYFFVPSLFFVLLLVLLVYAISIRFKNGPAKFAMIILTCIYAFIIQRNYSYPEVDNYGWYEQVDHYYTTVLDSSENPPEDTYIITLPHDPSWEIILPLDTLTKKEKRTIEHLQKMD